MSQASKVEKLPPEILAEVNRLLGQKVTLERIVERLATLGENISTSSLGRHKQKIEAVSERLGRSRMIAEAIGREVGDQPDDKLASLNVELLHTQVMNYLTKVEDGEVIELDPKDMRSMADALYRLSAARKTDTDRILKVQQEMAKKAANIAETELRKAPGMSADTVDNIKRKILGLAK